MLSEWQGIFRSESKLAIDFMRSAIVPRTSICPYFLPIRCDTRVNHLLTNSCIGKLFHLLPKCHCQIGIRDSHLTPTER